MRIGVISDTHGLLRPEAVEALKDVDAIVHAGDIGDRRVLDELAHIAPVSAVRGNIDADFEWASEIPWTRDMEIAGRRIHVLHDLKLIHFDPRAAVDIVISGHSHKPLLDERDGVLYLNPGSAGRRRFRLPVTLALLEIGETVSAEIVELDVPLAQQDKKRR